jgi:phosphoribosyl 1,2-cyclic phosphodiesterase/FixJ family two-component response regulator
MAAMSNSEFLRVFIPHRYPFAMKSLAPRHHLQIGIICRLEIDLTSCKQSADLDSNRPKNAGYNIRLSLIIQPASHGAPLPRIVIADDDDDIRSIVELGLNAFGFEVFAAPDGEEGLRLVREKKPDAVVLDLMMPKIHGFAVCQAIRNDPQLKGLFIVVGSAKAYAADIKKVKTLGANIYLQKPYDLQVLADTLRAGISQIPASATAAAQVSAPPKKPAQEVSIPTTPENSLLQVKFWGTRGSIATPGRQTLRYGGNTSCVEVRSGNSILLFDCGTGVREAGMGMLREFQKQPLHIHLFVSHTHWDHIQGFPFFTPAYIPGNKLSIYSLHGTDKSLERIFTGQMDSTYFPVDLTDMMAEFKFIELEGPVQIGDTTVRHVYLNHPGVALGFRVEHAGKSVVYVTDHEPYYRLLGDNDSSHKLDHEIDEFARGADLYIREAQYTEEEYPSHRSWGHGTWKDALNSAHAAKVRRLFLYHHDPMHDDESIDRIVESCRTYMRENGMTFECYAAGDQEMVSL